MGVYEARADNLALAINDFGVRVDVNVLGDARDELALYKKICSGGHDVVVCIVNQEDAAAQENS